MNHVSCSTLDPASGSRLERLIFNHRSCVLLICVAVTLLLCWPASRLQVTASFESTLATNHPFIRNYLNNAHELRGLGNTLTVVVENTDGTIFEPAFLERMRQINDALFIMPGVDRTGVKSIWSASSRWTEVTPEGFRGGPVMPSQYDGSAHSIEQLRTNVARAGLIGNQVSNDRRSALITVPILAADTQTGETLDYAALDARLEALRQQYEAPGHVRLHIIGFAKVMGTLIQGLNQVLSYFAVAALVAAAIIFCYIRCLRSTLLLLGCSIVAVIWQSGLLHLIGLTLDPYSMLVPFLIFAIGISHGAQKMNGIMQDIGRGQHRYVAARFTFRRLFLAGLAALLADAVGFAVLVFIDIPVIQHLAIAASLGVAVLIFTNLVLLPVVLSYVGVSPSAARRATLADESNAVPGLAFTFLTSLTRPARAWPALCIALCIGAVGYMVSLRLQVGDLDPGAPELRSDSRYNYDNSFITRHYSLSSDQFAVMVKTGPDGCQSFATLVEADRLSKQLRQIPQVLTTQSLPDTLRRILAGNSEGNPKWASLTRNPAILGNALYTAGTLSPDLFNRNCSLFPVIASLSDHRASTLEAVRTTVEQFAAGHDSSERHFLLAAGNAGIDATTNLVVEQASHAMLIYVYLAVGLLCLIVFRSWRATLIALAPLALTSILCEALMVTLDMGIKVATLPVIALGVGIGVDYALYLLSTQMAALRSGATLGQAYLLALQSTGRMVVLVGLTLAAAIVSWAWSPIKFQADMGILLTFMFTLNMVGALILIPALSGLLLSRANAKFPARTPHLSVQSPTR